MAGCSALGSCFEFKVKFREMRDLTPFPQGHSTSLSQFSLCCVSVPGEAHWERQHSGVQAERGALGMSTGRGLSLAATLYIPCKSCRLEGPVLAEKGWEDLSLGAGGKSAATGKT